MILANHRDTTSRSFASRLRRSPSRSRRPRQPRRRWMSASSSVSRSKADRSASSNGAIPTKCACWWSDASTVTSAPACGSPGALRRGRPRHFIDLWIPPSLNPDGRVAHERDRTRGVDLNWSSLPMAAGARGSLLPRAACRIGAGGPGSPCASSADRTRHHDLVPSAARVGGRTGDSPGRTAIRPLGRLAALFTSAGSTGPRRPGRSTSFGPPRRSSSSFRGGLRPREVRRYARAVYRPYPHAADAKGSAHSIRFRISQSAMLQT